MPPRCAATQVDLLAHPGLLTPEDAAEAAARGIFIEITSRGGHALGNGRVVAVGRAAGVRFLINSDSHAPTTCTPLPSPAPSASAPACPRRNWPW